MTISRMTLLIPATALFLGACSQQESGPATAAEPAESATPMAMPEEQPAAMPRTPAPEGARVFFVTPANGATVSNPVHVEFGIEGMDVVKAGVDQPHSGHHHLLVDTDLPDLSMPIPADANHIHFGDGSTSTDLTLEPGEHTLQLLLGDYLHIPHDPPVMSDRITITVE